MKENTKFLWMYVGILFSFALILIIFAGLSQNSDMEEAKGLKSNLVKITEDNANLKKTQTDLENQIAGLQSQVTDLQTQVTTLTTENEILAKEFGANDITPLLLEGIQAKEAGNSQKVKQIVASIDTTVLTELQLYVYNSLVE